MKKTYLIIGLTISLLLTGCGSQKLENNNNTNNTGTKIQNNTNTTGEKINSNNNNSGDEEEALKIIDDLLK